MPCSYPGACGLSMCAGAQAPRALSADRLDAQGELPPGPWLIAAQSDEADARRGPVRQAAFSLQIFHNQFAESCKFTQLSFRGPGHCAKERGTNPGRGA